MGMSASQARYLNLTGRLNDIEFQGQQINQSRTTLSDQTNNLYSQLQNLDVPTPPHTSDYTTIQYKGALGADKFTIGHIIPSGATYTVNLEFQKTGNSTYSVGKGEVKSVPQYIYTDEITGNGTDYISLGDISSYYVPDGNTYRVANANDFTFNAQDNRYILKQGVNYYHKNVEGDTPIDNPDFRGGIGYSLNGNALYEATRENLDDRMSDDKINSAIEALRNGFVDYAEYADDDLLDLFFVSFTTEGNIQVPHFTLKEDITVGGSENTYWAEFYDITPTGTYTETQTKEDCQLTFDTAGRITEIAIPTRNNANQVVYQKVKLAASTVTDEKAYEDAYNEYEYSKYEYDQEQLKINAQMSIIQSQDKKLELKLQRLDTERTQITTEIEAVKKVITDDIDSSYKTFSG